MDISDYYVISYLFFIFLLKYYNQIFFPFVRLSWRWISESKWLGHNFKLWWIDTEFHNITYYWCPEWTPGVGDGQGGLACWDSWGRKESDMTERLNWTELMSLSEHSLLVQQVTECFSCTKHWHLKAFPKKVFHLLTLLMMFFIIDFLFIKYLMT